MGKLKSELVRAAAERARTMLEHGAPREQVLRLLVNAAELVAGEDSVCSILMVDQEGLLRNASTPGLPADYLAAIDRLKPDAKVGTCAAAAATGQWW